MDVVVRTPHGDADIEIVAAPAATTLGQLLVAVTGQAAPATTRVDGRAIATTRLLSDIDLVIGSLIDTRPHAGGEHEADGDGAAVGLVQLTGRGAGKTIRLPHGRFRVGSARRLHADELERAPVETMAFDVRVDAHGVRVAPGSDIGGALGVYTPTLGTELFDRELDWTDERLNVGGRLFDLDIPHRRPERRPLASPNADGSIAFQRPPGGSPPRRRVVVDAVADAMSRGDGLWARRRTDPGAYSAVFGFHADGRTLAAVDLQRHRGVALVGSDRFTSALARTLLLELATQHGPADLDIVVASTPDHAAKWNWAKWLPHVRASGPSSSPEVYDQADTLATWADSQSDRTRNERGQLPITLLVLDDISLWSQRDSPVRSLLVDPPPELRVMALCVGLHEAPGMCTSLVEEVPPLDRLAHLTSVTATSGGGRPALFGSLATQHTRLADAPHVATDIHPALVEIPLAAEVARSLAPLDDLEADHETEADTRSTAPTLAELLDLAGPPTPPGAGGSHRSLDVPIGVLLPTPGATTIASDRTPVTVDLAGRLATIMVAGERARHDHSVAALLLGAAAQRRTDELAMLVVGYERPAWHSELPHIAGWVGRDEAEDASRLVHRVAHVLTEHPDLFVLIVIERAFDRNDPMPIELVGAMTELAESLPNVHLVLTGDHPDAIPESSRARCGAVAWIGDGGAGRLWVGDRQIPFHGVSPRSAADEPRGPAAFDPPELIVRPTTHGRAMTPLERRLSRSGTATSPSDGDGSETAAVARQVSTRTGGGSASPGPTLLPPPLPASIDFTAMLARHQGDGVPLGLVDRPERAENEAYWWQPGSGGSILAAGSPRSGMTTLIDLVICGAAARISSDDLHVYAVEALPQRRRALDALPHTGGVVTPDDPDAVQRLVDGLHREHAERVETRISSDRPDIVLLIADLSRMLRSLPADAADATMRRLSDIAATGPTVGMNVVAIAARVDDIGPLARLTGDRLVGATSDPMDRTRLGAPAVGPTDLHPGRCWSTAADRRVQLATPPTSLEEEIARLTSEPTGLRPPMPMSSQTSRRPGEGAAS